ncbi:MAG: non-reducing end alpha-L-arabinofuranosidase family hydrolase [Planctomycetales bacterium]
MRRSHLARFAAVAVLQIAAVSFAEEPLPAEFRWRASEPLVLPKDIAGISTYSIKDPSVVRHDGRWHLFCTIRGKERSHGIVYLSFEDWKDADKAERRLLPNHPGFFCAPQVFHFAPHKKWYLICQASSPDWTPNYGPAFATNDRIDDPAGWSKLEPMFDAKPGNVSAWLDFWVICDEDQAHLFFTSLDGKMWRSETPLDKFPRGWSRPEIALQGDIFEASHTYRLKGRETQKYLTFIEAQNGHGWRYFKAYTAERLKGPWQPLAATKDDAFASLKNAAQPAGRWTDAISHGEFLRETSDERCEVDPRNLRVVFQGALDRDRAGKPYGQIPWRLGVLTAAENGTE